MQDFIERFGLAFVPIFVAVDAIGILPMYMGLVEDVEAGIRRRVVKQAIITALVVAICFTFLGDAIFRLIGVTPADFKVAGGVLLFIIACIDIISMRKFTREPSSVGAVPVGIPLMVGPAVLTTLLITVKSYGYAPTLAALVVNIAFAGGLMMGGTAISHVMGPAVSKAITKVANLILAAFAVMMIRSGLAEIISTISQAR